MATLVFLYWIISVQRLGLDIAQVFPIHGRLVTFDETRHAVATYGKDQLWGK